MSIWSIGGYKQFEVFDQTPLDLAAGWSCSIIRLVKVPQLVGRLAQRLARLVYTE